MKNNNKTSADDIFQDFDSAQGKGIFARIPHSLHQEVLDIKAETGRSIYDIVERALKLFIAEYKARKESSENSQRKSFL